jgi:hypothetical protein
MNFLQTEFCGSSADPSGFIIYVAKSFFECTVLSEGSRVSSIVQQVAHCMSPKGKSANPWSEWKKNLKVSKD